MIGFLSILTPIENVLTWALEGLHYDVRPHLGVVDRRADDLVRMLLVPLTVRQIHSMQRMQQYLPEMKAIQKRYKSDRQKQNEELMKFYKENQINPASSCLPILPQIPIFFALYFVLHGLRRRDLSALSRAPTSAGSASSRTSPRTSPRTGRATCCSSSTSVSQVASTLLHVDARCSGRSA